MLQVPKVDHERKRLLLKIARDAETLFRAGLTQADIVDRLMARGFKVSAEVEAALDAAEFAVKFGRGDA